MNLSKEERQAAARRIAEAFADDPLACAEWQRPFELARKLKDVGEMRYNAYLLRFAPRDTGYELTVFRDGRAIIKGTEDVAVARAVYSRYVGS